MKNADLVMLKCLCLSLTYIVCHLLVQQCRMKNTLQIIHYILFFIYRIMLIILRFSTMFAYLLYLESHLLFLL